MTLTASADLTAASWIVDSGLPWKRLVTFGPSGFAAYARLRFIPDPSHVGQSETDHPGGPSRPEVEQLRAALDTLARHTSTPDDCYFCIWDGWLSDLEADDGVSAFPRKIVKAPELRVPNRAYYLFRGALSDFASWQVTDEPHRPRAHAMPNPAFVWPADHAWCVANDVDPHWAGIGADALAVDELVGAPGLDAVRADPDDEPPAYL